MVKRFCLLVILIVFCCFSFAQSVGTSFEDLTFEQLKTKAKNSGKLIFIDCYTEWCGPCKKMVRETFPLKEVGEYMDSTFISAKFDCEKGEGIDIRERFGVSSYPTYLILDSDGKVINTTGGFHNGNDFIVLLRKLSSSGINLDTYGKRYNEGDRSQQFIYDYCEMLIGAKQYQNVVKILDDLLIKDGFDKFYWPLYSTSCFNDYSSLVINHIVNNKAKVTELVGEDAVNKRLSSTFSLPLSRIYCVSELALDSTHLQLLETVRNLKMPKGNDLYYFIEAIKLRQEKKFDDLLSLYENEIFNLPITRRFSLDRGLFMIENLNPAQKNRVKTYAIKMLEKEPVGSKYASVYIKYVN